MVRNLSCIGAALLLTMTQGCDGSLLGSNAPLTTEAELIEAQQGDLIIGKVAYACGRWESGSPPAKRHLLVDLFLLRDSNASPSVGPSEEHIRAITDAGGRVLHRFTVPAVRVEIPTDTLPKLVGYGDPDRRVANHARWVPRGGRWDVQVSVGYTGDGESAIELFKNLGGHVTAVLDAHPDYPVHSFQGIAPDSALPHLRAMDSVEFVEYNGVLCLG